jgi:hypothetical protein
VQPGSCVVDVCVAPLVTCRGAVTWDPCQLWHAGQGRVYMAAAVSLGALCVLCLCHTTCCVVCVCATCVKAEQLSLWQLLSRAALENSAALAGRYNWQTLAVVVCVVCVYVCQGCLCVSVRVGLCVCVFVCEAE